MRSIKLHEESIHLAEFKHKPGRMKVGYLTGGLGRETCRKKKGLKREGQQRKSAHVFWLMQISVSCQEINMCQNAGMDTVCMLRL